MRAEIGPAAAHDGAALREAFDAAFADYLIGPPSLGAADWPAFLQRQGVALDASRVALAEGRPVAFALVGRRGARSRLATMGVVPAARGSGVAQCLLDRVLDEARKRGDASFELEVFAQNPRAVALYRSRGFESVAELHGYERAPGAAAAPAEAPDETSLTDASERLRALPAGLLPYQVSAEALAASAAPLVAWRHGGAQLVFERRGEALVAVASLVDRSESQADARLLARALAAAHPEATLRVPQLQRPELGGRALEAEGWRRLELHQLLMRRAL